MKIELEEMIMEPWKGHVHASTLLELADGGILAAWFQGSRESAADVAICGSRRIQGRWEPVRTLAKVGEMAHWNPVLRRGDDGRIVLYFKVSTTISDWQTFFVESRDDGLTWSVAQELVPGDNSGGRGPVKNKCLRLSDGSWLAGASVERGAWDVFTDRSEDDGRSWRRSELIRRPAVRTEDKSRNYELGVIQPSLWEWAPGKVSMLVRSNAGRLYRSDSEDYGRSWCELYATELPNNNSGIDLVKRRDGKLVLLGNSTASNWGGRGRLVAWVSEDNGVSWSEELVVCECKDGEQPAGCPNELSYPCIIELSDGRLAACHTWHRCRMRFVVLG